MRPTTRNRRAAAVVALAVPALILTACGSDGSSSASASGSSSSASASASSSASSSADASSSAATAPALTPAEKGDLAGVKVEGADSAAPKIVIDKTPFKVDKTTVKVVKEGDGQTLAATDTVVANAVFVSAKTGKVLDDTYAKKAPQTMAVKDWITGVAKGLVGQKSGSQLLIAIAPADGAALIAERNTQLGLAKDDTILAFVDVKTPPKPLKEATGAAVAPKAGLPTVKFEYGKPATITVPKTAAPKTLEVQTLVQGDGKTVEKGQTVQVHYTGVTWADGKKFDSSFDRGTEPTAFPIGVSQVIPAWDKAIVGKKVGSRLLIVAPPNEAYGAQANGAIPANSTLVFVVDILGAY